jgi:hypothetical protein
MHQSTKILPAALAASCFSLAACSGSGTSSSSPVSDAAAASTKQAAVAATASASGTTIPSATSITDSSANVWTVVAGVVHENAALAGYSSGVTLLLYDTKTVYQENAAGGWWSWNGTTWASSSDPRKTASANGTTIPAATQITDSSGNVWVVSGGVIYKNGVLAGYSSGVTTLAYDKAVIYQENAADNWWSWNGTTWTSSSAPVSGGTSPPTISGSPTTADTVGEAYSFVPTTTNPGGGTMSFSVANRPAWGVFSTATGALTGTPSNVQAGDYANIVITVSSGGQSASLAAFAVTVSDGSAALSWSAPTENTNGSALTDLEGYTIHYGTSPSEMTQTVQLASATATSYTVSNLISGTYYFEVEAYATDGTVSAESTSGTKTIL